MQEGQLFCTHCGKKIGIAVAVVLVVFVVAGGFFYLLYQDKLAWNKWVSDYEEAMNSFYLSEDEKEDYKDYLTTAKEAQNEEQRNQIQKKMEKLQKTVKAENDAYIKEIDANIQKIEQDYDLSYALEDELKDIGMSKETINTLKNQHSYPEAVAESEHCKGNEILYQEKPGYSGRTAVVFGSYRY